MSKVVGTYVIGDMAYEIHGEREMQPLVDENGIRVNKKYDYYDIYTTGRGLTYLVCVNEGHPFKELPTEAEVEAYLEDE